VKSERSQNEETSKRSSRRIGETTRSRSERTERRNKKDAYEVKTDHGFDEDGFRRRRVGEEGLEGRREVGRGASLENVERPTSAQLGGQTARKIKTYLARSYYCYREVPPSGTYDPRLSLPRRTASHTQTRAPTVLLDVQIDHSIPKVVSQLPSESRGEESWSYGCWPELGETRCDRGERHPKLVVVAELPELDSRSLGGR